MSDTYINIPESGSPSWKNPVDTFASLPANGNKNGDVRVTLDTSDVYEWNGLIWKLIAGPDAGGINNLNGLSGPSQTFVTGTSGSDFNINSAGTTHTFNLPTASATVRGALSSADWSTFNNKQPTITIGALDAQAENANGLALVSNVLSTQSADSTHPGMVNNTTQTLSGDKTFTGNTLIAQFTASEATIGVVGSTALHDLNGGLEFTTRTITTNLTIDTTKTDYIILADTSGGAITITLPAPTDGRILIIIDSKGTAGTNNITVAQHASEKIEGVAASKVLSTNFGSWTFTSNGTDWFIAGGAGKIVTATFAASGTWVAPAGVTKVSIWGRPGAGGGGGGSGGGGGAAGATAGGGGGGKAGGSGAASQFFPTSSIVVPGTSYAITIGAGGVGGTAGTSGAGSAGASNGAASGAGGNGGNGGITSFDSLVSFGKGATGSVIGAGGGGGATSSGGGTTAGAGGAGGTQGARGTSYNNIGNTSVTGIGSPITSGNGGSNAGTAGGTSTFPAVNGENDNQFANGTISGGVAGVGGTGNGGKWGGGGGGAPGSPGELSDNGMFGSGPGAGTSTPGGTAGNGGNASATNGVNGGNGGVGTVGVFGNGGAGGGGGGGGGAGGTTGGNGGTGGAGANGSDGYLIIQWVE